MNATENCREIAERREVMSLLINKMSEAGAWDSMKAKDVPDEIVQHVLSELSLGKSPVEVRREMGIKSQTSKEWAKISAAIKMGYRVNATTYFHHLISRQERMAGKLEKVINHVLDQDVDTLQETEDAKGNSIFSYWAKDIAGLIDSYNRLTQGIIKNGKDLGVFADPGSEGAKGTGPTIIVKSHITLGPKEPIPTTFDVSKKELPKP